MIILPSVAVLPLPFVSSPAYRPLPTPALPLHPPAEAAVEETGEEVRTKRAGASERRTPAEP